MELRMTVHLPRRRPRPVEVVVRWEGRQDARALRRALAEHLGEPVAALAVAGAGVPDDAVVGMPPLLDGASVAVLPRARARVGPEPAAALTLVTVGGPDAGRARPLRPPGLDVGRAPPSGLRVEDPTLSRTHARIHVDADGLRVEDLGSTNGVRVDGCPVVGRTAIDTGSLLVMGRTPLRVRRPGGAGLPLEHPGDGTVVVRPARVAAPAPRPVHLESPMAPVVAHRPRVPWPAVLLPLPVAAALAVALGPRYLAVALLGPVALLATVAADRWSGRRRGARQTREHEKAVRTVRRRVEEALAEERRVRHRAHPDPHLVLERVEGRLAGLWSHDGSPVVRLGLGDVESHVATLEGPRARPEVARAVPVVLDLLEVGCLGVVGSAEAVRRSLDWVLGQLCAARPPGALALVLADGHEAGPEWWRVPHHGDGPGLRVTVASADRLAGGPRPATGGAGTTLVTARRRGDLPAGCGAVLELGDDGDHLEDAAGARHPLVADGVGGWWTERMVRALAPLRHHPGDRPAPLPRRLDLPAVLGPRRLTVDGVRAHWAGRGNGGPIAVVGRAADGPYRVDLCRDGPHVLVGGTTGSGKSEFLRTLVTALALDLPPERLALLLVDFKGGAAFGPCAALPHVVGLVTDLDDHLAGRVLTSLRAELRHREEVLAAAGVADLDELAERSGDGSPCASPPRLVVVVDELKTLLEELPGVVHGLVRLAAQGRSLGIHVVLATQRPAGTLTADIQANVDLRIAFRVRDRTDSSDVVEDPAAAAIPVTTPGRALARGGDGLLVAFQAALVAPPPPAAAPGIEVVAAVRRGPAPRAPSRDRTEETAQVVRTVRSAADGRGVAAPPPPWLPPLPADVVRGVDGVRAGTVALVDEPERQRRTLLDAYPAPPLWRVVGRPLSGRSGALRALVTASAQQRGPEDLHVHVIDAGGDLEDLCSLPHVGTWCRADDTDAVEALATHLSEAARARRGAVRPGRADPEVLLVVDGWEQLVEADDPRAPDPVSERLLRVLRDAGGWGVRGAVSGGRALLHSRWSALGGEVLLTGSPDPLDAVTAGLREQDLPGRPPAGRGILVRDAREVQVVRITASDLHATGRAQPPLTDPSRSPWRYRPLPGLVRRREVPASDLPGEGLLLGLAGPTARPWRWRPDETGGCLLVAGPPRSGRTTALRVLATSARDEGRAVVLVAGRGALGGVGPAAGWLDTSVLDPTDVAALLTRCSARPDALVLVDDADRLDGAPVLPVLAELAERAAGGRGAVAASTTSSALPTRFRGLDATLARLGHALVLSPGPADGDLLGVRLRAAPEHRPGRGVVVIGGHTSAIQVLADPEPP